VDAAKAAEESFEKVFQKGGVPDDLPEMRCTATDPIALPQLLVDADLVKSTSEARRMIKQSAVSIDGEKVTDMKMEIQPQGEMLIKVGKRRFSKVIFD
jgi:tyrosyl-tRNA synthetase